MAPKLKKASKEKLERTCAIYFTNEQMEVLREFVKEAFESEPESSEKDELLCICAGFTTLFESWEAFQDDTDEPYSYRFHFRQKSAREIRSLKSYLRHQINRAFRINPESMVAEQLKIPLKAIMIMLSHVPNLPFDYHPDRSEYQTVEQIERRRFANSTRRLGRLP